MLRDINLGGGLLGMCEADGRGSWKKQFFGGYLLVILLSSFLLVLPSPPVSAAPVADPGGPYEVDEGGAVILHGENSTGTGTLTYSWVIVIDPTESAYLTDADTSNPVFHAPQVTQDENVYVRLTVTDDSGNSSSAVTTVTIKDLLIANPGGPYEVAEGGTVTLDGTGSSGDIENYSWVIVEDPTGGCWLTNGSTSKPTFHASADVSRNENVTVRLLVVASDNTYHSADTTVVVKDLVTANAGGPYTVLEGDTVLLVGANSTGSNGGEVKEFSWTITSDPTGEAYLTDADEENAVFHAPPDVLGDVKITVRLFVLDNYGEHDIDETEVIVKDALIANAGSDVTARAGENVMLDGGESKGSIEIFSWAIVSDPTGKAYLSNASTPTPTLHTPADISDEVVIGVKLTVAGSGLSDTDVVYVKVVSNLPPSSPSNLKCDGKTNPGVVSNPAPLLSSVFVDEDPNEVATRVQIQVGTGQNGSDMWDYTQSGITVPVGSEHAVTYDGKPLLPGETYYWRVRYYNGSSWGEWSDGTATFTMGTMRSIIENGASGGQEEEAAEILLELDPSEAAEAMGEAIPSCAAEVMEKAVLLNPAGTLAILQAMSAEVRAEILVQICELPDSPSDAALLLELMSVEMATETVKAVMEEKEFDALDSIFSELSSDRANEIFESLTSDQRRELYSHFSSEAREKILPELRPKGGINWFLVGGILGVVAAAIFVLRRRSLKEGEGVAGAPSRPSVPDKWSELVGAFLKSGKPQAAVRSPLPAGEVAESLKSAILRQGVQGLVGIKRVGERVYLVRRRAQRPSRPPEETPKEEVKPEVKPEGLKELIGETL